MTSSNRSNDKEIAQRKAEVDNYVSSLRGVLSMKSLIDKKNGDFYFGGSLHYAEKEGKAQTPDIVVGIGGEYLIGEVKKSLRNPSTFEKSEEYLKYVDEEIMEQIRKYDNKFKEIDKDSHDLFLLVPYRNNEAVGRIRYDYLEPHESSLEKVFRNNFGLITFSIESGANTQFIIVKLETGFVSNKELYDALKLGWNKSLGELKGDLGRYKIYQESDKTPVEYVMILLWTEVFPEIINKNSIEKILEWQDDEGHIFEVTHETLLSYLHEFYTCPSFGCNPKKQFNSKLVGRAMHLFSTISVKNSKTKSMEPIVEVLNDDKKTKYRVKYRRFRSGDELDHILKALCSKPAKKLNGAKKKEFKQGTLEDAGVLMTR